MQELNTMLAELSGEGALESSGVFTMSLEKAGEKLAAFRLLNPGLFVLNLVAAAVCSGARNFAVETKDNVTTFTFDPVVDIEVDQLEKIFTYIMEPSAAPHLREMALAVHGARALPEQPAISLSVASTERCYVLEVKGDLVDVVLGRSRVPAVTFRLEYPSRGGWSRLFGPKSSSQDQVLQHLFHFCRFAPMDISDNGKAQGYRVTGGVYDSAVFAWRRLKGTQTLKAVSAERRFDLLISRKYDSAVASSMVLVLTTAPTPGNEGLLLISRGVTFRRPVETLGFSLAHAVVTADHLEKNLSQSDLVEDERYEALISAIQAEVDDLVLELCAAPPPGWVAANVEVFTRALEQRYPSGQPEPIQVETFRRLRQLEKSAQNHAMVKEQMIFWRGLVDTAPPSAAGFGKKLAQLLTAKVERGLATASWQEALSDLLSLIELKSQPMDSLVPALMVLAGQSKDARLLLTPELPGYSPMLVYLLGWSDTLEGPGRMEKLLRFQRAVATGQLETADGLAEDLQSADGTTLLFLWLGWYELFRKRYSNSVQLWERALKEVDSGERGSLATLLWPYLSGKVGFLDQVRWIARRGLDGLSNSLAPGERSRRQGSLASRQVQWAQRIWLIQLKGQPVGAQEAFLTDLLASLVNPTARRLESVNSRDISLSFFR